MITFQLLSKDGSSLDDAEVLSGRWQAYVEGFVSEVETPGVPTSKVRRPFLRRFVTTSTQSSIHLYSYTHHRQTGLYPPQPWRRRREQRQRQDPNFTRAADWRSKSACGPTVFSTSRGPRMCCGACPRARKTSARARGSRRGMRVVRDGLRSFRLAGLRAGWSQLPLLLHLLPLRWKPP